jgi:hypothetical protein
MISQPTPAALRARACAAIQGRFAGGEPFDESELEGLGGPVPDKLGGCLADHFDIGHSTFQIEPPGHRDHEPILHR